MTPMMMTVKYWETYSYLETDAFQAIRLPYANSRFTMCVFPPRKRDGLGELLKTFDQPHWKEWTSKLSSKQGTIVLPKFQLRYVSR